MLATSGKSMILIGKVLGHSTALATEIYARLSRDPVKEALEDHAKQLMVAAGKREPAEVIDFAEAKRQR